MLAAEWLAERGFGEAAGCRIEGIEADISEVDEQIKERMPADWSPSRPVPAARRIDEVT